MGCRRGGERIGTEIFLSFFTESGEKPMGMAFFVRTGGVAAVGSHGGEAVATPKIVAPNNCLPFFLFSLGLRSRSSSCLDRCPLKVYNFGSS
jgi:hypothetical protein